MRFFILLILLGQRFPGTAQSSAQHAPSTLIFPLQDEHVHGSSLVVLPNGDLLAAWFQGSGERKANDVRIMGARRSKGTGKWSAPFLMADTPGWPDCNPVLFFNHQQQLFLAWIAVRANKWETSLLRYRRADLYLEDGPPVWSWQDDMLLNPGSDFAASVEEGFRQLGDGGVGWAEYAPPYERMIIEASQDPVKRTTGWMTRQPPLLLENQRILLPLYSDGFNLSLMAISEDDGQTWSCSLPIVGKGPIQPTLAQRRDGAILAFMRDSGDAPSRIHTSISTDQGYSWTPSKKIAIANTASVAVLVLHDGRWLLVCNDVADGRYRLTALISNDEGQTWKTSRYLENDHVDGGRYSYPTVRQDGEGIIHLTYSYHLADGKKSIKYINLEPETLK